MCCLRRYAEVIDWGGSSHAEARMTVALVVATAAARGRPSGLAGPAGIASRGGPQRPASIVREDAVREGPVRQGAGSTAGLSLPGLQGGEVTTEPLLTRVCGQLSALGVSDIFLIAPPGQADPLAAMAWDGVSVPGSTDGEGTSIDVLTCASVAEELRAAASVARRAGVSGESLLICAGDLVAHTEALARLCRGSGTGALTAALTRGEALATSDQRPALRIAGRPRRALVAAGSAFHRVHAPNATGCGAFLVSARDADELAAAADELALLAVGDLSVTARQEGPPPDRGAVAVKDAKDTAGSARKRSRRARSCANVCKPPIRRKLPPPS